MPDTAALDAPAASSASSDAANTVSGVPKRSTRPHAARGPMSGASASASHASRSDMRSGSGYYTCAGVANHLAISHAPRGRALAADPRHGHAFGGGAFVARKRLPAVKVGVPPKLMQ